MKNNNNNITETPLLVRALLNPAAGIFRQCTESTRNNFLSLSQVLLFTVLVCGCILGCSISKFGFGSALLSYFITIPLGIGFYWFIDKQIIMADASKNLAFIKKSRYFVAIVFGLLNSLLIDSLWFSDDIRAAREKEIATEQLSIQKSADSLRTIYQAKKDMLYATINAASSEMNSRMDSLITEYQGRSVSGLRGAGKDYRVKYTAYKNDSSEFVRTNSLMSAEAAKYDTLIAGINVQTATRKAEVTGQVSQGINHSMELLHKVIWLDGNIVNMLMALLILLGSMILELLPLIGKHYYDLEEYFSWVNSEKESSKANADIRKHNYISREAQRLNFQNQRIMNNEYADHILQSLKDEMDRDEQLIRVTDKHLENLEQHQANMEKRWPKYYDEYIKPLFSKVFERFKQSTQKSFSKQKFEAS